MREYGKDLERLYEEAKAYIEADFDANVPCEGMCETMHGEFNRAVSKIGYRYFNDGDHIGVDYGNQTCNPAARFLLNKLNRKQPYAADVIEIITAMWGEYSESAYEKLLKTLVIEFANFQCANSEFNTEIPAVDMYTFQTYDDTHYETEDDEWDEEYWDEECEDEAC